MQKEKGFIQYVVILIIILVVVFFSQQPSFREVGKNVYSQVEAQVGLYWSKASDWVKVNVYPKVSSEVEKRGEAIKEEVNKQKDAAVKSIWDNIKNYFANIFSKTTGTSVQ